MTAVNIRNKAMGNGYIGYIARREKAFNDVPFGTDQQV